MKKDEARLGKGLGAIFGDDLSNVIEEIRRAGSVDQGAWCFHSGIAAQIRQRL